MSQPFCPGPHMFLSPQTEKSASQVKHKHTIRYRNASSLSLQSLPSVSGGSFLRLADLPLINRQIVERQRPHGPGGAFLPPRPLWMRDLVPSCVHGFSNSAPWNLSSGAVSTGKDTVSEIILNGHHILSFEDSFP